MSAQWVIIIIARIQVSQTPCFVFLLFCGSALSVLLFAKKLNAVLVDAVVVSEAPRTKLLPKPRGKRKQARVYISIDRTEKLVQWSQQVGDTLK